jgi:hypothetical protein
MGWVDTVLRRNCHEIYGIVAVQQTQFNVVRRAKDTLAIAGVLLALSLPVRAAGVAADSKPDPLLNDGPTTACAAGADYAAGTDVNGHPVTPADVAAGPVPVPGAIAVPLAKNRQGSRAGDSAYVSLDGKKLEPLLNPPPCH